MEAIASRMSQSSKPWITVSYISLTIHIGMRNGNKETDQAIDTHLEVAHTSNSPKGSGGGRHDEMENEM